MRDVYGCSSILEVKGINLFRESKVIFNYRLQFQQNTLRLSHIVAGVNYVEIKNIFTLFGKERLERPV
jgi:hypothetical protein